MAQIFVSYAREDEDFVLKLANDLRRKDVDFWLDQFDIVPGSERWDDQIQAALETCPHLLVVLSPSSVASQNVKDEINYALEKNKPIFSILYQACDIPFRIRRFQYIDFREDYKHALAELLQVLPAPGDTRKKSPKTKSATPRQTEKRSMRTRSIYAIVGLLIGAVTNVVLGLLASATQQQWFGGQFSPQSIWWLAGLALAGSLIGYWLGGEKQIQVPDPAAADPQASPKTVTVTRLKAYLSKIKVRGKGIHIKDVSSFGSNIDISTNDKD